MSHTPTPWTDKTDGGAAFPTLGRELTDLTGAVVTSGMSLRDYFAGQFAIGLADSVPLGEARHGAIKTRAKLAYDMADAMLAEREKQ